MIKWTRTQSTLTYQGCVSAELKLSIPNPQASRLRKPKIVKQLRVSSMKRLSLDLMMKIRMMLARLSIKMILRRTKKEWTLILMDSWPREMMSRLGTLKKEHLINSCRTCTKMTERELILQCKQLCLDRTEREREAKLWERTMILTTSRRGSRRDSRRGSRIC
jgi:hypothetical protein